jgi:hypothetical protein
MKKTAIFGLIILLLITSCNSGNNRNSVVTAQKSPSTDSVDSKEFSTKFLNYQNDLTINIKTATQIRMTQPLESRFEYYRHLYKLLTINKLPQNIGNVKIGVDKLSKYFDLSTNNPESYVESRLDESIVHKIDSVIDRMKNLNRTEILYENIALFAENFSSIYCFSVNGEVVGNLYRVFVDPCGSSGPISFLFDIHDNIDKIGIITREPREFQPYKEKLKVLAGEGYVLIFYGDHERQINYLQNDVYEFNHEVYKEDDAHCCATYEIKYTAIYKNQGFTLSGPVYYKKCNPEGDGGEAHALDNWDEL